MNNTEIQKRIDNLESAIAEGALEIDFQGKRIKYRSLDEMQRILNMLKQSLQKKYVIRKSIAVFEKY